jgi:hypothetical protein
VSSESLTTRGLSAPNSPSYLTLSPRTRSLSSPFIVHSVPDQIHELGAQQVPVAPTGSGSRRSFACFTAQIISPRETCRTSRLRENHTPLHAGCLMGAPAVTPGRSRRVRRSPPASRCHFPSAHLDKAKHRGELTVVPGRSTVAQRRTVEPGVSAPHAPRRDLLQVVGRRLPDEARERRLEGSACEAPEVPGLPVPQHPHAG